jgi:hypothetical protein
LWLHAVLTGDQGFRGVILVRKVTLKLPRFIEHQLEFRGHGMYNVRGAE